MVIIHCYLEVENAKILKFHMNNSFLHELTFQYFLAVA